MRLAPRFARLVTRRRRADDALPCRQSRARIVRGEAGQRAVDQRRVRREQPLGAEAETIHDPGTEVFDEYVGGRGELLGDCAVVLGRQVERDAALATVPDRVRRRVVQRSSGRVDTDHFGALIAEHHRGQRPGDVLPEVDDADAIQRTSH